MRLHPCLRAAARGDLPAWSRVSSERRAHISRVAGLLSEWAGHLEAPDDELDRWRAAGFLHDALKDEDPRALRSLVDPHFHSFPEEILHGPAASAKLRKEGVTDEAFHLAIAYHSIGHPGFDLLGRCLYLADFLEPERGHEREWRAGLRERMPGEAPGVILEVARSRIKRVLDQDRALQADTVAFWNRLRGEIHGQVQAG